MPVVTVQMWTGRTPTQKRALCKAITEAMVQHAGAKPTNLHVIIQEVPKEDWALAGVMGDEKGLTMTTDTMTKTEAAAGVSDYAHMLLKVSDIARSEQFYVDLLGFKIRPAKPLPDGRPFVPFTQGIALTSGGAKNSPQIDHIAFKAKDVRAIAARLKAANVKFDRDLHDGIYGLTIYVFDPDGTMIELYEEGQKMP